MLIARRGLHETLRFAGVQAVAREVGLNQTSLWEPWRPRFRRTLSIGFLHFFRNLVTASGVAWFAFSA